MNKLKRIFRKENITPFSIIGSICAIASLFLGVYIIYWYFNGISTDDMLQGIKDKEVAGEVVPAPVVKTIETQPTEPEVTFPFVPMDFKELKERNEETVAWLKFDAVKVNMPIVQTTDNEFYLSHDIDKKANSLGWVFVDVRSNMEYLGTNTVIYGHNTANKQMFGTLKDIFNTDPEKKEQNEIIQLTTLTSQMVFEITSVYVTTYEDWKYVQQQFPDDESKRAFVNRMQEKNTMPIFQRDDLSINDQFLTFSTCYGPAGTEDRLVIHARLIAEQPNK